MTLYPLGTVMEIIESIGAADGAPDLGFSYAYEDLVFLTHNAFLLQFTPNGKEMLIHRNVEADEDEVSPGIAALMRAGAKERMFFSEGRQYRMKQEDDEHISIDFLTQR